MVATAADVVDLVAVEVAAAAVAALVGLAKTEDSVVGQEVGATRTEQEQGLLAMGSAVAGSAAGVEVEARQERHTMV